MIWLNNVQTIDQVAEAIERIPGPVMPTYGGPQPGPTLGQLHQLGAAAAIFPGGSWRRQSTPISAWTSYDPKRVPVASVIWRGS